LLRLMNFRYPQKKNSTVTMQADGKGAGKTLQRG
jgi:hypothetical protein